MPTKIVNLNGTLNLQDDEFAIGLNGFTELINLRQENGKLIRRLGTGALVTHTNKEIDGMEIFVNRKLQSVQIDASVSQWAFHTVNKTFTMAAGAGGGGGDVTQGITIPGTDSEDWTTVLKVGDTVVFDGTSSNDNRPYIISAITFTQDSAAQMTFENPPVSNEASTSLDLKIGFGWYAENLTTPGDLAVEPFGGFDSSSYDGRAFLTSIVNHNSATNKQIITLNPSDFSDVHILKDFGAGTTDMHIRVNAYADAVRFACGLEHSPRIFKYINRHFFNGILKSVVNTNAEGLYPRWIIDTAVPTLVANTYHTSDIISDSAIGATSDSATVKLIDGSLNLKQDFYDYKFVPVYDGTQEDILDNAVIEASTSAIGKKKEEKSGILSVERSCVRITSKIDLTLLNPRTSALNVYRSTNGGTYYKIKSIYMGDDDPFQKTITARKTRDLLWFKGLATLASDTLDDLELVVSGFKFDIDDGTGVNDYNSTGYKAVDLVNFKTYFETSARINDDAKMSPEYYGSHDLGLWNKKCETTYTIFANNGEATGGSADGGWFFAEATERCNATSSSSIADDVGDMTISADTGIDAPFDALTVSANVTNVLEWQIVNRSATADSMGHIDITDPIDDATAHIISGWIQVSGMNSPSAEWCIFVSSNASLTDTSETGDQVIAQGVGGSQNQNIDKWRWFQYEFTTTGTNLNLYARINHNGEDGVKGANVIRIKNLSLRKQTVADYKITDGLVGFGGSDILVDEDIADLGVPEGVLKGNRISNNATQAYPTTVSGEYSFIADNVGPFIKCASETIGGSTDSDVDDTYFLGTSNYQFYATTDSTTQHMNLDFFDPGLPDGARHPYEGSTSLNVKYKYSTMLNGRQFVANVRIASDGETEEYPNFVMFSGSNAPDIIPISSFIQLQDLQGGEIVGIETLMSDIVVFMTNGIFRLNVPSDNPANWSLVEAHPNIGAIHDRGITKAPNGIYFCGRSDVFFLDSGFQASPITGPIRDIYQDKAATLSSETNLNLFYDAKYNRLYMNYTPSLSSVVYVFDITRGIWYQDLYESLVNGLKHFTKDNENKTIFIDRGTSSGIQYAEGSNYNDDNDTDHSVDISMKTGKQIFSTLDKKSMIRRVNTIITKSASSGKDLDLDIITDQGPISKDSYLDGTQSTRIANRGKFVQIGINNDGDTADSYEYEINHVDVEYE